MSKRQALREFQTQLAQRLAAAKATAQGTRWLAVECAGLGVLLPLQQASEIFATLQVTPVPYTQPWMLGVANLRGGLHAVVDLSQFLGLRQRAQSDSSSRLVAFSGELNINCALLVDRLLGLRSAEQMQHVDDGGVTRPHFASECRVDAQGRRWQVLDLALLARFEPFLQIVAAA